MSTYDVVLLMEQALGDLDVRQVRSLHEEIEEPVVYHVLLPAEDAAARVEAGMSTLGSGELLATTVPLMPSEEIEELQQDLLSQATRDVDETVAKLKAAGAQADGRVAKEDPVHALVAAAKSVSAAEVIVLTREHVVSEFFHLDWSSRARRKLGVPVLHLLERESFDEQSEGYGGEGVTGL